MATEYFYILSNNLQQSEWIKNVYSTKFREILYGFATFSDLPFRYSFIFNDIRTIYT